MRVLYLRGREGRLFFLFCPLGVRKPGKKKRSLSFISAPHLFSVDEKSPISFSSLFSLFFLTIGVPRTHESSSQPSLLEPAYTHQPLGFALTVPNTLCGLFSPWISILDLWDKSRGLRGGSGQHWVSYTGLSDPTPISRGESGSVQVSRPP